MSSASAYRGYVWLVECRDDDGNWYPCGHSVHWTASDAVEEARALGGAGKRRVRKWVRQQAERKR